MTLATYSIPTILGIWVAGSFLLGATWIVLVRIEAHLNRRERRAARLSRGATDEASRVSQGNGYSSRAPVPTPPAEWLRELDEVEWAWIAPYDSPLQGGRKRRR